MVGLLILAGLSEGVGLLSLLPLLQHMAGTASEATGPAGAVGTLLGAVGLGPTPGPLLLLIVVAITLKGLLLWLAMREVGYTVARVANELRLRLIRALTRADWRYFTGQPAGHFTTALGNEAQRASRAYMDACEGLAGLIQTAIYLAVVWALSWRAALLAVVLGGVVGFALRGLIGMTREAGWRQTRIMRSMIARSGEVLTGVKSIKAMGREDDVWPMIERETQEFQVAQERLVLARESLRASHEPIAVAIVGAGLYLTLGYAGIAFSSLLVLAVVFYRLLTKASELQGQYQSMVTNESAFWTLHDHIERAEAAREHDGGSTPPPVPFRAIRFDRVALGHGDGDVLSGLSLTLPAGSLIAFEGPSGAGKSTLVDAIVGLAAPTAGRILVDDVPLSEIDATRWRRSIGYVPQEVLLFHDTVRANVTLGNPRFDDAAVRAALGSAGALEFVEALPDELDHVVGERGTRLSGGQRQRIAIARALIGAPALLVLDEATAALDPETEAEICRTLLSLRPAVTVLAISHQPAVREVADLAFEVAGGTVVPMEGGVPVAATGT